MKEQRKPCLRGGCNRSEMGPQTRSGRRNHPMYEYCCFVCYNKSLGIFSGKDHASICDLVEWEKQKSDRGEMLTEIEGKLHAVVKEREELYEALSLSRGQLHSAALSAIRGKNATIHELITRAESAEAELAENTGVMQILRRHREEAEAQVEKLVKELATAKGEIDARRRELLRANERLTAVKGALDHCDRGSAIAVRAALRPLCPGCGEPEDNGQQHGYAGGLDGGCV